MQMAAACKVFAMAVGLAAADYLHLMQRRAHLTEENLTASRLQGVTECDGVDCEVSKNASGVALAQEDVLRQLGGLPEWSQPTHIENASPAVLAAVPAVAGSHPLTAVSEEDGYDQDMTGIGLDRLLRAHQVAVEKRRMDADDEEEDIESVSFDQLLYAHDAAMEDRIHESMEAARKADSEEPFYVYPLAGDSYVKWDLCKKYYYSNLGGMGPKNGTKEELRFFRVAHVRDANDVEYKLDLVVENVSGYLPNAPQNNGRMGNSCFGQVNVASSFDATNSVTLRFSWYLAGSRVPVKFEQSFFTLYDIDGTKKASEAITFYDDVYTVYTSDTTELTQTGSLGSGLTFSADGFTNNVELPQDPMNLTAEQENRAVTLEYQEASSFTVTLSVSGGNSGRNFAFSSYSSLVDNYAGQTYPTPAPTTGTPQLRTPFPTVACGGAACSIFEDPHIQVFDGSRIALLDVDAEQQSLARYGSGDWWLVKSEDVSIQGRYLPDPDLPEKNLFVRAVAVGGPFLNGSTLILGSLEDGITWNGQPILESQTSDFLVDVGVGQVNATRHMNSHLVQDMTKTNAGVDIDLPHDVKITLNRYKKHVNILIDMQPAPGGQEGLCGNFNCNSADDSLDMIMANRNPRVLPQDSLFPQ